MTAAASHSQDAQPVEHSLLVWLHHVIEHFDAIYIRRRDPKTGSWHRARLSSLTVGDAFNCVAYLAGRGRLPVATARKGRELELHPTVVWLRYLVDHFSCIYVTYQDGDGEREVRLRDLPIEEAFYWISVWACGSDAYVASADQGAIEEDST